MSATMACNDFLQTSGQWPASLRRPPAWPPMPRAQVLQAFRVVMARHSRRHPTRRAMRRVYRIEAQPPPRVMRVIRPPSSQQRGGGQLTPRDCTRLTLWHEKAESPNAARHVSRSYLTSQSCEFALTASPEPVYNAVP